MCWFVGNPNCPGILGSLKTMLRAVHRPSKPYPIANDITTLLCALTMSFTSSLRITRIIWQSRFFRFVGLMMGGTGCAWAGYEEELQKGCIWWHTISLNIGWHTDTSSFLEVLVVMYYKSRGVSTIGSSYIIYCMIQCGAIFSQGRWNNVSDTWTGETGYWRFLTSNSIWISLHVSCKWLEAEALLSHISGIWVQTSKIQSTAMIKLWNWLHINSMSQKFVITVHVWASLIRGQSWHMMAAQGCLVGIFWP